ncbi:hypothetical protein BCO37747_06898 [Burkholderia contaminans]|nr:hypothetical protein BCO23253_06532 [Burkholderia contaminans]VWD57784.1 hypothetical protein BCO37747_06898 [Burkholderia contaminans]
MLLDRYVNVPSVFNVSVPLAGGVWTFTPYTPESFAITPLAGSDTLSVVPGTK